MKIKLQIFFLLSIFIIAMTKVNAQTLSESYDNELSGEVAYKHLDYRGAKKVTFLLNNELLGVRATEVILSFEKKKYQYCVVNYNGSTSCDEKIYSSDEFDKRLDILCEYIESNNALPNSPLKLQKK